MEGANRLEKFQMERINRQDIMEADYNPRKISDDAAKKLRKFLRENGLWSPLVVNRPTMTLVSGHQRLAAMDTILRKPDYEVTVAMVEVDQETEVKGNVFLNNPSAQGEWDVFKLESIKDIVPDIDFEADLGFDPADISVMFDTDDTAAFTQVDENHEQTPEHDPQHYRDIKKRTRDDQKEGRESGENVGAAVEDIDYSVTFVFPNNHEKRRFMRKVRKPEQEKYLKSSLLMDIYLQAYDLTATGDKEEREKRE